MAKRDTNFGELADMVVQGDHHGAAVWIEASLATGADPMAVISEGLVAAMDEIGRRWKAGRIFLPEVLVAARAMKTGMALVRPLSD